MVVAVGAFGIEPAGGALTDRSELKKNPGGRCWLPPARARKRLSTGNPAETPRPNARTGGDPRPAERRKARHRAPNRKNDDGQTSAQRHPGGSPGPTRGGSAARNKSNESTTTTGGKHSPGRTNTGARARAQAAGERKRERTTRAPEHPRPSRSGSGTNTVSYTHLTLPTTPYV